MSSTAPTASPVSVANARESGKLRALKGHANKISRALTPENVSLPFALEITVGRSEPAKTCVAPLFANARSAIGRVPSVIRLCSPRTPSSPR